MLQLNADHFAFTHQTTAQRNERFALHCHPSYELFYFVRGDVRYLVEGVPYKPAPHSLLLMASGSFHGILIESDAPYERYTVHLDGRRLPEAAREALLAPFSVADIYHDHAEAYRIEAFLQAIGECVGMDEPVRSVALEARLTALLSQVCMMHTASGANAHPGKSLPLDRQILAYINENLTGTLTLDGIARQFFISRNQVCRLVAQATGTTVGAYVRRKRLYLAQNLRAQGQSAGEAAANAGFGDYSTYYRAHRKVLGQAPVR